MKETPKQKAIREAWESAGFVWNEIKHLVQEWDGSIMVLDDVNLKYQLTSYGEAVEKKLIKAVGMTGKGLMIKLASLSGVNSNNGWIRTDEQMPNDGEPIVYIDRFGHQRNGFLVDRVFVSDTGWRYDVETITHWRPKEIYPKPIY